MADSLLIATLVLVFGLLLIFAGMRPIRPKLSLFELKRRIKAGQKSEKNNLQRAQQYDAIARLLDVKKAGLLVAFSLISVAIFGWLIGVLLSVAVVLSHATLARLPFLRRIGAWLYQKIEPRLIKLSKRLSPILKTNQSASLPISSKDELAHVISQLKGVLSPNERQMLLRALEFDGRLVADVMTPRSKIASVKGSELLGPLTLDELHKTGHNFLPVVEGNIDQIIGILNLQEQTIATSRKTLTAAEAMSGQVLRVQESQTLAQALTELLQAHQHLLIVVNRQNKTVGLLSLTDIVESLLGRENPHQPLLN